MLQYYNKYDINVPDSLYRIDNANTSPVQKKRKKSDVFRLCSIRHYNFLTIIGLLCASFSSLSFYVQLRSTRSLRVILAQNKLD